MSLRKLALLRAGVEPQELQSQSFAVFLALHKDPDAARIHFEEAEQYREALEKQVAEQEEKLRQGGICSAEFKMLGCPADLRQYAHGSQQNAQNSPQQPAALQMQSPVIVRQLQARKRLLELQAQEDERRQKSLEKATRSPKSTSASLPIAAQRSGSSKNGMQKEKEKLELTRQQHLKAEEEARLKAEERQAEKKAYMERLEQQRAAEEAEKVRQRQQQYEKRQSRIRELREAQQSEIDASKAEFDQKMQAALEKQQKQTKDAAAQRQSRQMEQAAALQAQIERMRASKENGVAEKQKQLLEKQKIAQEQLRARQAEREAQTDEQRAAQEAQRVKILQNFRAEVQKNQRKKETLLSKHESDKKTALGHVQEVNAARRQTAEKRLAEVETRRKAAVQRQRARDYERQLRVLESEERIAQVRNRKAQQMQQLEQRRLIAGMVEEAAADADAGAEVDVEVALLRLQALLRDGAWATAAAGPEGDQQLFKAGAGVGVGVGAEVGAGVSVSAGASAGTGVNAGAAGSTPATNADANAELARQTKKVAQQVADGLEQ